MQNNLAAARLCKLFSLLHAFERGHVLRKVFDQAKVSLLEMDFFVP